MTSIPTSSMRLEPNKWPTLPWMHFVTRMSSDPKASLSLARCFASEFDFTSCHGRQFPSHAFRLWNQAKKLAQPDASCLKHYITGTADYVTSVIQEANDRANGRLRTVENYLVIRRDTCGAKPTFALIEFGLDIPEEVLFHPSVSKLTRGATDLIAVINVRFPFLFTVYPFFC